MPVFPGGQAGLLKFFNENLVYPESAKKRGATGKVYLRFVIDTTGQVIEPTVVRGLDPDLDAEALRLLRLMPRWEPGEQLGRPVKVSMYFPIEFKLEEPVQPVAAYRKIDSADMSIALCVNGGVMGLLGDMGSKVGNMAMLGYGAHLGIKRVNLIAEIELDFGSITKQSFEANGYWRKGRPVTLFATNLLIGYSLRRHGGWEYMPYTGIRAGAFGSTKKEEDDPADGFQLTQAGLPVGIMAVYRYNLKDRGPMRAKASILQFGLEYHYMKFHQNLMGHCIQIKVKWGRDWQGLRRFERLRAA